MGFLDAFKARLGHLRPKRAAAGPVKKAKLPVSPPSPAIRDKEKKVRLTHCEDIA